MEWPAVAAGVGARTKYLYPAGLSAADDSRCSDIVPGREPGPAADDTRLPDNLRRRVQGRLRPGLADRPGLPVHPGAGVDGTRQRRPSTDTGTRAPGPGGVPIHGRRTAVR